MAKTDETKREIAAAFEEIMQQKPIDKIRVTEVAQAAGVTKQTFYRHFTDKYELMEFCFRQMFAEPIEGIRTSVAFDHCVRALLTTAADHKQFCLNAFGSNDVNSLFKAMRDVVREAMLVRIESHGVVDEGEIKFMADFYVKGLTGLTRRWLSVGMDLSLDTISNYAVSCLPAKLAPFFR